MAAQIHAHGGVAEERTYGGVGHLTLIGALAPGLRVLAPVLGEIIQFVWRVTSRRRWQLRNEGQRLAQSNLHSERAGWLTEGLIAITRRADAHWTTQ
jgi:hypothetical protein